jgi:hypothetical protein
MPDVSQTSQPQAAGADQSKQMQEIMLRLMKSVAQPKTSVQPPEGAERPRETGGHQPQQFVHGLFGMIQQGVQAQKQQQLRHATGVLQSLNNSWMKAQELAQGDQEKAKQLFSQMPEVTHIFEDKKNVKQLGKLLQFDFMEPEKKKTVWHEALAKVVEASQHLPIIKAISGMMQKHKDSQKSQEYDPAAKEQQASTMASRFAGQAQADPTQQAEVGKMLPSMVAATGADVREREKELHAVHLQEMKQDFAKSVDSIKNPGDKAFARGMQLSGEGNQVEAQKYFDSAKKYFDTKKGPGIMNLNKAISDATRPDATPEDKKKAKDWISEYQQMQSSLVSARGVAFGMGRLYNWENPDTGETKAMNGFQVQEAQKSGETWIMTTPVSVQLLLPAQQIVRSMNDPAPGTKTSLRDDLISDMKAFDNASDRAIISRVLRENPSVYAQDSNTLGVWLDQNLTDRLSSEGQKLVRDVKLYAEVFNRTAAITGQTRTEMNTMMLLALLPNERTPNSKYGMQQLQGSFNYLDGMVQAPILGGGRLAGRKAAPKSDTPKPDEKPRIVPLD